MTRAETAALVGVIESGPVEVFVGTVPDGSEYPYALVRPALGTDEQDRMTGPYATGTPSWTVLCFGVDVEQTEWVVEHVDSALRPNGVGVTPTVPHRSCGRIRRDTLQPLLIDDDTSPPGFYRVAEYSFRSAPSN